MTEKIDLEEYLIRYLVDNENEDAQCGWIYTDPDCEKERAEQIARFEHDTNIHIHPVCRVEWEDIQFNPSQYGYQIDYTTKIHPKTMTVYMVRYTYSAPSWRLINAHDNKQQLRRAIREWKSQEL